jgi:hypothetical protein
MDAEKKLFFQLFFETRVGRLLQCWQTNGRIMAAHAILLIGNPVSGVDQVGQYVVTSALCLTGENPASGCSCVSCAALARGVHPDVVLVDMRTGIDAVKEMRAALQRSPLLSEGRVAWITGVDEASQPAVNALLKTIEEPRGKAKIVLTARSFRVPATVQSRVATLALMPHSPASLERLLCGGGIAPDRAKAASTGSAGYLWQAVNTALSASSTLNCDDSLRQSLEVSQQLRLGGDNRVLWARRGAKLLDAIATSSLVSSMTFSNQQLAAMYATFY